MTRAPGWYEDPQDPNTLRYHDGVEWSGRTTPRQKPDLDRAGIGQAGTAARPSAAPEHHRPEPGPGPGLPRAGGTPYRVPAPTTPDGQPLSGWWRRVAALVLDYLVVSILAVPFVWAPYQQIAAGLEQWWAELVTTAEAGSTQAPELPGGLIGPLALMGLIYFAVYAVYEVTFLVWRGATPGKMAAGISVRLRERPGPPPLPAALVRVLVKEGPTALGAVPVISTLALLFQVLDRLWPLWDGRRQSIHDKVARTNVVVGSQHRAD